VTHIEQTSNFKSGTLVTVSANTREVGIRAMREKEISDLRASEAMGVENMLGIIAAILIVLWLLGFAFHVSTGLIHLLLVIGIVMLLVHLLRGRSATS